MAWTLAAVAARRWDLELLPGKFDERGECHLITGASAEAILQRVAGLSAELDTELRVEGTRGHLVIRA